MKNKIIVGILVGLISLNIIGCGCGTPKQEETLTTTIENESVKETESMEIVTETVEDYSDDTEETEEVVSEDATEEVVEETPVENTNPYNIVDCDPVTKYTNTGSNIRSIPDKNGELIDTVAINTELTVTGTTEDGSWSRVEHAGMVCFVKSSLLSDSKTKVQTSNNSGGSSSNSGGGSSSSNSNSGGTSSSNSNSGGGSSNNSGGGAAAGNPDLSGMFGSNPQGGSGGYGGGTTGSTTEGENWGGAY